jgi:hypothetical protein
MSVIDGRPRRLPGVALDSAVLLHGERGLALLVVTVAALSVALHAARSRLAIELSTSGLRYEATDGRRCGRRGRAAAGPVPMTWWRSSMRSPSDSTIRPPIRHKRRACARPRSLTVIVCGW